MNGKIFAALLFCAAVSTSAWTQCLRSSSLFHFGAQDPTIRLLAAPSFPSADSLPSCAPLRKPGPAWVWPLSLSTTTSLAPQPALPELSAVDSGGNDKPPLETEETTGQGDFSSSHDRSAFSAYASSSLGGFANSDPSNQSGSQNDQNEPPDKGRYPARYGTADREQSVQWKSLLRAELLFLVTMHAYRIGTENGTREALQNRVWGGYLQALGALHGWSDGDGYYETYLGHPIQGAVASYMWIHNDPKYRVVEFGKSRDYWMSRLRAYAWSYVEQEQFKLGLLSEATIGQISRYCCAYGFNDHVITSNGGMVWMVAGDAADRYIVRRIEDHTRNVPLRIAARLVFNPPLGMANLMNLQYPWYRENRPAPSHYEGQLFLQPANPAPRELSLIPKFEATASIPSAMWFSNLSCLGGFGVLGYHITGSWQWTGEVGGCMLSGKSKGWSGDSLTFMTGPQWILHSQSRWSPHFHLRAGGQKITEEYCLQYGPLPTGLQPGRACETDPTGYAKHYETTGVALSTGVGMDVALTKALSLRLADLNYVHTWVPNLNGTDFSDGVRVSIGLGLKIGTW